MRFQPSRVFAALVAATSALHAAPQITMEQPAGTPLVTNHIVGFGSNDQSQLAIPTALTGVVDVAAGGSSSVALMIDGTVIGWGNYIGGSPVTIPAGLSGVTAISTSEFNGNALKSDGSVVTWGNNTAIPASPLTNLAVSAGSAWSVAIKSDSTAVVWGQNLPTVPAGMSGLVAVSAGQLHVVGLKANGTVVAWGNNSNGQINVPAGLTGVVAIAAGKRFSLALKSNGTVVSWGFNDNGGGLPVGVPGGVSGVVAIDADGPALALKNNDTIIGWGRSFEGQLTPPAGLTKIRKIASGDFHSLALSGSEAAYGPQILGAPVTRTFTIKNTGADPLTISSVALFGEDTSQFTLDTTGLLTTLPALTGQTTCSVTFNPATLGAKKTFLRVLSDDTTTGTFEILLTGTGTTSKMAVFGNTLTINDGDTTPSRFDFTDFRSAITAGNDSVTRTFMVTNSGTGTLTLGNVTVTGPQAADFFIATPPAPTVAPGGSTTFQVTFNPSVSGLRSATLNLANNDSGKNPFDFAIQGTGVEPEIAVSEAGVDIPSGSNPANIFGDVLLTGGTSGRTFTVTNSGASPLTLGALSISGPNAADFYVDVPPDSSVAAGASTTFQIVFDPSATGLRQATLSFTNNDANENPVTFALQGSCIDPKIAVSANGVNIAAGDTTPSAADSTDFGVVGFPKESLAHTFTVSNTGSGPLSLGGVSITGGNAEDFSVTAQPAATVAQGGSTTIEISFRPRALGLRSATLELPSNDANQDTFTFALQGTGVSPEISIEQPDGTLLVTGGVIAWGSNASGQLNVPAGLAGVVAVDSSDRHTLALKSDGTIVAWGANEAGQLNIPAGLKDVVGIAAGSGHTMVLRSDGTVLAWGRDNDGESDVPVGLSGVTAIAAGGIQSNALLNDGTVVRWGYNSGNDTGTTAGLTGGSKIAAGDLFGLGLKPNGTVIGWGLNYEHEIDPPGILHGVVAIAGGRHHSLALKADHTISLWGDDDFGVIGSAPFGLNAFVAIAAGSNHDVALKTDGTLVAWGDDSSGQTDIPAGLTGVRAIAAGSAHTVAVIDSTVDFGAQLTGSPSLAKTFTIKNAGTGVLTLANIGITGANAGDFTLDLAGLTSIVPATAGQTTFTVTFTPGGIGPRHARLRVLNDDAVEGTFDILLAGFGSPPVLTPRETWRQTWFGNSANTGPGADAADPDGDGLVNLIEYAFGLNPTVASAGQLPALANDGTALTWDFTAPAATTDVTYGAEWSTSLTPGTWTAIPDTGTAPHHVFTLPRDGRPNLFLRLVVTPSP